MFSYRSSFYRKNRRRQLRETSLHGNLCPRTTSGVILGESHLDSDRFHDGRPLDSLLALIARLPMGCAIRKLIRGVGSG